MDRSLKNKIEDFLDRTIGRRGRKALEQVAHFLLIGAPWGCIGAGVVWWIDSSNDTQSPIGVYITAGLLTAIIRATWREVAQNIGDEPDESTRLTIGRLPINRDMIIDWVITASGGIVPGVGFYFI